MRTIIETGPDVEKARRWHQRINGNSSRAWYVRYEGQELDGPFRTKAEAADEMELYRKQWRTFPDPEAFELHSEAK